VTALRSACETEGISYLNLVSRAYHDSLFLSRIAPVAMLFIPCRDGVSHRPDEYSSPETIERGVAVLARTLASLSSI
jgi:N-carbamoyl-L-amino-acid hydrolase